MNKENNILENAREIFQILDPQKQAKIKNNEPELYKMLFDNNSKQDNAIIEDFVKRYRPEISNFEKARLVFSKLPLETQAAIKHNTPKMYEALFDVKSSNSSLINEFLEKYEPLNEKIKSFDDFEKLSFEDQLFFKTNFPEDYSKIISTEPK